MDKILRNINEQLWREAKARAALEGKSMKSWIEGVMARELGKEHLLEEQKDRRKR